MKARMKDSTLFWLSLGSFSLTAMSFLLMAPWPGLEESEARKLLAGLLFWTSVAAGCISQCVLNSRRKKWLRYYRRKERQRRCGLLTFCASPLGTAADACLLLSVLGFGISLWRTQSVGIICYFFLGFVFFSLITHCIFNGKNYNYIQHLAKSKIGRVYSSGQRRRERNEEKNDS